MGKQPQAILPYTVSYRWGRRGGRPTFTRALTLDLKPAPFRESEVPFTFYFLSSFVTRSFFREAPAQSGPERLRGRGGGGGGVLWFVTAHLTSLTPTKTPRAKVEIERLTICRAFENMTLR